MAEKTVQGELVFGVHAVVELLKAKRRKVISIYTTKPVPKAWELVEPLLPKYPINIQYVSRESLHKISRHNRPSRNSCLGTTISLSQKIF